MEYYMHVYYINMHKTECHKLSSRHYRDNDRLFYHPNRYGYISNKASGPALEMQCEKPNMKLFKEKVDERLALMEARKAGRTIKLHARVTREIEITEEEAKRLINKLCGDVDDNIDGILERFKEDIKPGSYEAGYIPYDWLESDLTKWINQKTAAQMLFDRIKDKEDIEL